METWLHQVLFETDVRIGYSVKKCAKFKYYNIQVYFSKLTKQQARDTQTIARLKYFIFSWKGNECWSIFRNLSKFWHPSTIFVDLIWVLKSQYLFFDQFPYLSCQLLLNKAFWGRPCPYPKLYPTNLTSSISFVTWGVELVLRKINHENYRYNLG